MHPPPSSSAPRIARRARSAPPMRALAALAALTACSPPPPRDGELQVLTYNVQGLPDPFTDSDRPGEERMAAIAPLLDAYDVVGLQEDFDPAKHALLTATGHPERAWFSSKVDDQRVYGAGLSILSRVARAAYDERHYSQCHGVTDAASDCLASKGLQRLTIPLGGALVDVLNTHHEAGGGPADIAARESQIDEVLRALAERPDRAVVFVGDMNLRPSRPADAAGIARYTGAGLRDGCAEAGCPEGDHIDQIYVRDGVDLRWAVRDWRNVDPTFRFAEGDPMSDHPPITATIAWEIVD
jgi:endonuclease/exonuclease/phosphatase family metal-dependent hydrolase